MFSRFPGSGFWDLGGRGGDVHDWQHSSTFVCLQSKGCNLCMFIETISMPLMCFSKLLSNVARTPLQHGRNCALVDYSSHSSLWSLTPMHRRRGGAVLSFHSLYAEFTCTLYAKFTFKVLQAPFTSCCEQLASLRGSGLQTLPI